ncbi:MAG: hypothetical protein LJE91_16665 [Gammaproteobacteria bacterium]|jgi:hypothetical protein|nr:hypothetical protein [Gammaproteobacteria bacterium]
MIASIRNLALLSTILPALALTGCGGGSGDGSTASATPGGGDFVFETGPEGSEHPDVAYPSLPGGGDTVLALSWDANPAEENIQYYEVMYGSEENQVDYFYIQTMNERSFNPNTPAVEIETSDLAHANEGYVCFAVKSYNDFSESEPSEAVCTGV